MFFSFFFSSRRRHTRCALVLEFRRVLFRSLEQPPQAQRDVRILGGIFGRLVERDFGEADLALAGAAHILEADADMVEVDPGRLVHAVARTALPGVAVEAHDDGVVIWGDLYPVAAQDRDENRRAAWRERVWL